MQIHCKMTSVATVSFREASLSHGPKQHAAGVLVAHVAEHPMLGSWRGKLVPSHESCPSAE